MAILFSKKTALTLFCYFRQAERSVHYALSCPSQWRQFVAYYDESRQAQITALLGMLKDAGAVLDRVPKRQAVAPNGWLSMARSVAGFFLNSLKNSWSFSVDEVSFFAATLEELLKVLHLDEPLDKKKLTELRLDCFTCHYTIRQRLIGVPEIHRADTIEHFNQSKYVSHVSLQDLGIELGARTERIKSR